MDINVYISERTHVTINPTQAFGQYATYGTFSNPIYLVDT